MAPIDPLTAAVFLLVLSLAWYFYPRKKFKLPPGPRPWPIIGSTIDMWRSGHGEKVYLYFKDLKSIYGNIIRVKTAFADMIVVNDVASALEVFVTKSADYAGRTSTYYFDLMTEGRKDISLADYDETWRVQRKLCSAALRNFLSGKQLEERTRASLEKGLRLFDQKIGQGGFDPKQLLAILVYNIVCAMCFNTNFDVDDPDFNMLFNISKEMTETFGLGLSIKDFVPLTRYLPFKSKTEKRITRLIDAHLSYTKGQIKEHQESFSEDNVRDLVDHLTKAERDTRGKGGENTALLSETHYRQIIEDMFTAGTGTTSYTLYWIVLLMCLHPETQENVQQEIDAIVGDARLPGMADKPKMPYCEAVMYECMRYSSLVSMGLPHKTLQDTTLGDYEIPKGTMVMVNHYAIHFDRDEWNNPEIFDPNHFLDYDGKLLPKPRAFLPFGAGKRVCVGESVAKPEIFMVYTALLQRFIFRLAESTDVPDRPLINDQALLLRLPKPFRVQIEKRA